jgi:hemolysin-activating ACP:hemolysin acyltransferase
MRRSFLNVYSKPAEDRRAQAEQLGYAALLMSQSAIHRDNTIWYFNLIVAPAVYQRKIRFYFNEDGDPVGYVIWALLAADIEQAVLSTGAFGLQEGEWGEGDSLWIVDLLAPFGNLKYILQDLRDSLFKDYQRVRYLRRKGDRVVAREVERNPRRAFFHTAAGASPVRPAAIHISPTS